MLRLDQEESLDNAEKVVALNNRILGQHGIDLSLSADILDFGCGEGRHTYEYLDAGYKNIIGFDIQNYLALRQKSDLGYFRFPESEDDYSLPFPDNSFDFVTSTQVFEHVQDQQEAISEIARVLKPGGVSLHNFPSRWRPVECHIAVPFGGAIQSSWWMALWARLGVRSELQKGRDAPSVIESNLHFCANNLNYPSTGAIERHWRAQFESVIFAEKAFIDGSRPISRLSRLAYPLVAVVPPLALALYRAAHTHVVLARKPKP